MIQPQPLSHDYYRSLKASGESLFKDRGSKFIGLALEAKNAGQAVQKLEEVKNTYHDARHHCFAFRCKPKSPEIRINDDGEPAHSAGTPIYKQIITEDIWNVLVVVVRYFGGTKLGVPGLINAYKNAARQALATAPKKTMYIYRQFELRFPYTEMSLAMNALRDSGLEIVQEKMQADAGYIVRIRESRAQNALQILEPVNAIKLTEIS